ncbi:aldehyde dehydrogenase (NADP(+)) [Grimontia sp. NTOU-MAR1]|uniref:aldehyde dehydrogenase (NADP(+)) n=1 Tax=Grimontia sp. NTOU-MAR1 TaxID=3111011 RepID=UPI002DBB51D6|nr:aldehyde dehydrogenase (NADP(+)) [Grimontia sp. NTOU-MAR1]WRV98189.1 aldehyde dehydrogenase (NADP(+)) [Grimontia sp. NTOU-MAR1]
MSVKGVMFISGQDVFGQTGQLYSMNPATSLPIEPLFAGASPEQAMLACTEADKAFESYRQTSPKQRAAFLRTIAENIMSLGDELLERGTLETGLPIARLTGERGRTCAQLNLFADVLENGRWQDIRIDTALPDRTPLPRPHLGMKKVPLGPVVVFGSSNFPLAFSVAGGDTASALAAGCPVIVKGHPAHMGVSELVGRCIVEAVKSCELHPGTFSLVFANGNSIAHELVAHPSVKAVGFTGSQAAGLALMQTAQSRKEPIPVYAEMSSINPVVLMPKALDADPEGLANQFAASLTMGAGQFCTNPGLVLATPSASLTKFIEQVKQQLKDNSAGTMLTGNIQQNYAAAKNNLVNHHDVSLVAEGLSGGVNHCTPALVEVASKAFLDDDSLHAEVFGAFSMLVTCQNTADIIDVIQRLEGQLTGTVHANSEDDPECIHGIVSAMELKVGRILFNGFPTGVEVSSAMVHGGPYPSTSNSQTTSVGTLAIDRFVRPVCYQNVPEAFLPDELKADNPLNVSRTIDGQPE